jgi:hypothetical protein
MRSVSANALAWGTVVLVCPLTRFTADVKILHMAIFLIVIEKSTASGFVEEDLEN